MYNCKNQVNLSGEVSSLEYDHTFQSERFYRFILKVRRMSGVYDELPIIISENKIKTLKSGDFAYIKGEIRSRRVIESGQNHLKVYIFTYDMERYSKEDYNVFYANDVNNVEIEGFAGRPVISRITPFGRVVADIMLAMNCKKENIWKNYYIPCIVWGQNAIWTEQQPKGAKFSINGRFQSREYDKVYPDGRVDARITYEVSIGKISIVTI